MPDDFTLWGVPDIEYLSGVDLDSGIDELIYEGVLCGGDSGWDLIAYPARAVWFPQSRVRW